LTSSGNFVRGTAILAITGLVIKIIGLALRIILGALIGDEGIGLYQMAYPVYTTLLIISTAGIPIAVSKLVAENLTHNDYRGAFRFFKVALVIIILMGLIISCLLALAADFLSREVAQDQRAFLPILSISPAIFLVSIMAALRGFFQGQQRMEPTALSQLMEQLFRVIVSIGLVFLLIPLGVEYAAAGATFGAVVGALAGLVTLIIIYLKHNKKFHYNLRNQSEDSPQLLRKVLYRIGALSAPVMLGSIIIPITNLIDFAVVPLRLHHAGLGEHATALYGQLTGMAGSIIHLPTVIGVALTISLVPAISEANALDNKALLRYRVETAQRLAMLFSIPSAVGLFLLSDNITFMLFDNLEAGYPLSVLGWTVIFSILYQSTTGVHQGMGLPMIPVINMITGGVVKLLVSWILTGIPEINIGGAALGTVSGFLVASLLNLHSVSRLTGARMDIYQSILKPLAGVFMMSIVVLGSYALSFDWGQVYLNVRQANTLGTLISIALGAPTYVFFLILLGALKEEDLRFIPRWGETIINWSRKLKIMKPD